MTRDQLDASLSEQIAELESLIAQQQQEQRRLSEQSTELQDMLQRLRAVRGSLRALRQ